MKSLRFLAVILGLIVMSPFILVSHFRQSRKEESRRRTGDETDDSLAWAERRLGRKLPLALRAFYLSGRPRRPAPEGTWFGLSGAVDEYREITASPYGPKGQEWPSNLFPIADLLHGYACFDLSGDEIVEWDPDEIVGGDESDAAWQRSFTRTGKSLADWAR